METHEKQQDIGRRQRGESYVNNNNIYIYMCICFYVCDDGEAYGQSYIE